MTVSPRNGCFQHDEVLTTRRPLEPLFAAYAVARAGDSTEFSKVGEIGDKRTIYIFGGLVGICILLLV